MVQRAGNGDCIAPIADGMHDECINLAVLRWSLDRKAPVAAGERTTLGTLPLQSRTSNWSERPIGTASTDRANQWLAKCCKGSKAE